MVEKLGDSVLFYKIGLQLFMAGGYFELLEWLRARKKKVFADLKFFDVPQTVQSAVLALKGRDIELSPFTAMTKDHEGRPRRTRTT